TSRGASWADLLLQPVRRAPEPPHPLRVEPSLNQLQLLRSVGESSVQGRLQALLSPSLRRLSPSSLSVSSLATDAASMETGGSGGGTDGGFDSP
ncbi:hypothetical protein PMAYCL1PPCAC_33381, partial [Pristionchus mayeri]